jgi:hypothetical protein
VEKDTTVLQMECGRKGNRILNLRLCNAMLFIYFIRLFSIKPIFTNRIGFCMRMRAMSGEIPNQFPVPCCTTCCSSKTTSLLPGVGIDGSDVELGYGEFLHAISLHLCK